MFVGLGRLTPMVSTRYSRPGLKNFIFVPFLIVPSMTRKRTITPRYDPAVGRTRIGFAYGSEPADLGAVGAAERAEQGVAAVTLFEHDRQVYGPMSLSA